MSRINMYILIGIIGGILVTIAIAGYRYEATNTGKKRHTEATEHRDSLSKGINNNIQLSKEELKSDIKKLGDDIISKIDKGISNSSSERKLIDNYISYVSKILTHKNKPTEIDNQSKIELNHKTRLVFESISNQQKPLLLKFLWESRLITKETNVISLGDISFENTVFEGLSFGSSIFDKCNFNNAVFNKCDFMDAFFDNCKMINTTFNHCTMHFVLFQRTDIDKANFIKCDIAGWQIGHSEINEKQLRESNDYFDIKFYGGKEIVKSRK